MENGTMNRLGGEKSPYLLQHRDNPVAWYPWGESAFEAARLADKPVFLSIGYSTCYWCHVMAHDSFEDAEVARVLDAGFISIKLDREERPDIDQIYMDAVVGLTGRGGWPLTVFLTPDRKPFFGGTFFYRAQFLEVLRRIGEAWRDDRARIEHAAGEIARELSERTPAEVVAGPELTPELLTTGVARLEDSFDDVAGGFGHAPKFPPSMHLRFLLRDYARTQRGESLTMVTTTLDRMMRGGIYDHLAGGFARYSTDAAWLVPHFEKMTYDNALLAVTYLEGYQVTGRAAYRAVVEETLGYLKTTLRSPEGGFYSAEDAGPVGREGEFYVFTAAELRAGLSAEAYAQAVALFTITDEGNFEHGRNVLALSPTATWEDRAGEKGAALRRALRELRECRPRPHLDDKVLTSWSALAMTAFARAGAVLSIPTYTECAACAGEFIFERLYRSGTLLHRYRDGESAIPGFLDDYAYLVEACLALFLAGAGERWLERARQVQARQDEFFLDRGGGGYFYSAADDVLFRKKEVLDGALPAANAVACENLVALFDLTGEREYGERARAVIAPLGPVLERYPHAVTRLLCVVDRLVGPRETLVIAPGADGRGTETLAAARAAFLPRSLVVQWMPDAEAGVHHGKGPVGEATTIYRCSERGCEPPWTGGWGSFPRSP